MRPSALFVINSLVGGGAEKFFCTLVADLEPLLSDYDVYVVLLDTLERKYALPAGVKVIDLDARHNPLRSVVRLVRVIGRIQPKFVLSFLSRSNAAAVIAKFLFGYRCVISERVQSSAHFSRGWKDRILRLLVSATYRHADAVVAVSEGVAIDLNRHFGVPRAKLRAINNYYDFELISQKAHEASPLALPDRYVISVGRLVENKNYAMLMRAFAQSHLRIPLVVLGEGPERAALEKMVADLGLSGRVLLPGFIDNPFALVQRAAFYVCASNAEGFPNAIVEAMSLGCPVISTNCKSGPSDIMLGVPEIEISKVTATPFGLLVPPNDAEQMAEALVRMSEPGLHEQLRLAGIERSRNYSKQVVLPQYEHVLRQGLT